MNNFKLIICGKSCSGKSHLIKQLVVRYGYRYGCKHTTRPQRPNEIDGVDYHFISDDVFNEMEYNGQFICNQTFYINKNTHNYVWKYGLSEESFSNNNLFILTPHEINQIKTRNIGVLNNIIVIYLDIDLKTRYKRMIKRNDENDAYLRRINSDEMDFNNFFDYNILIKNPYFTVDEVIDKIINYDKNNWTNTQI